MRLFTYLRSENLLFIFWRDRQIFLKYIVGFLSYISRAFRDILDSRIVVSKRGFSSFGRNAYLVYIEVSLDEDDNDESCRSRDARV